MSADIAAAAKGLGCSDAALEYGRTMAPRLLTRGRIERHLSGPELAALMALAYDAGHLAGTLTTPPKGKA